MYRFQISISVDRTAPASGFPSHSNSQHRLHQSVAIAVRDDQHRSVGSVPVTFCSPLAEPTPRALAPLLTLCWNFTGRYSLWYCEEARASPLPYNRSSSNLLYFSILLISWCMPSRGCMVKESLNSDPLGRPSQKVLVATYSFSLPISLYSSQYLFV